MEVWENTLRFFCVEKSGLSETYKGRKKKEWEGGFEVFYHVWLGIFCWVLQNCTVLQFPRSSRLLVLEPTEG